MMVEAAARNLSIIIPAKNESGAIGALVAEVRRLYTNAEILVVDDGSEDDTAQLAEAAGATVVSHPVSLGNGAAVKAGARAATGDVLVMMDGDGQHQPKDIAALVDRIPDLTSGFRASRADYFRRFLYLLPNGFSYPTTITMAFLRSGFPVTFVPIKAEERTGKSHIRPVRDGLRFLAIIFKIATLYAPLKVFLPISGVFFASGLGYYAYTFVTVGRFTNMSMLILSASVIIFLIGLISEQITALTFTKS
jgi:glycosyltransferase involved in cell wall biosynthesis